MRWRDRAAAAAFCALASAMAATAQAAPAPGSCAVGSLNTDIGIALPHVQQRVHAGEPLTIVAIGSSSTAGAGASSPQNAYPARLAAELRSLWPGIAVQVINRGINGETASDMMRRFDRDVFAAAPDLVVWQVGTNTMLRQDGLGDHATVLREGIARLKAHDVDVVLLDPQYAPKVLADPDHGPIVALIARLVAEQHVGLFPRYALMRGWVERNGLGFADFLQPDGLHQNDWGYACLARQLSTALVRAARSEPRTDASR